MSTRISDIIVPEVFAPYMLEQSLEADKLVQSGVIVENPAISKYLAGGGSTFNFPSFKSIDEGTTPVNVPTSDATVLATPESLTGRAQRAIRVERNRVFGSTDLTASLAGADPLQAAASMLGRAILKWRQASLLSVVQGVIAMLPDHVLSVAVQDETQVQAANKFSTSGLIDSQAAFGDLGLEPGTILAMHSDVKRLLQKNQPNLFIPTAQTNIGLDSYMGYPTLVDDRIGKVANTAANGFVYTIYTIKPGAIEFGYTQHANPVEVQRFVAGGNGAGSEQLAARDIFTYHVVGTKWQGTPAGDIVADSELATSGNWSQVFLSKAIGICAYSFNM